MLLDVLQFRAEFPQFADPVAYPDASILLWLRTANSLLPESRWGVYLAFGRGLFVAHNLALAQARGTGRGAGGMTTGIAQSKTVDKVSVSYDTKLGIEANAGLFGLTSYGNQFLYYARLLGSGGIQL